MRRLRRIRKNKVIRDLIGEINLRIENIVMPYFVKDGKTDEIPSMPGILRYSIEDLMREIEVIYKGNLRAIILFGVLEREKRNEIKEEVHPFAYSENGPVQRAIRRIKENFPEILIISDVCLCNYTKHGHCGIVKNKGNSYYIDNDETLKIYEKIAISHALAGSDFVAPSGMMDFQVKAIRDALDREGFYDVGIISYSVKYSSYFYYPFRDALNSSPSFGDRKSYQMDFRNIKECFSEVEKDIEEGADIVMVKPALPYLDIISKISERFSIPVCAYNVSGEYLMVKEYCRNFKDEELEKNVVFEVLTAIKRSGADFIITYHGRDILKWI